MKWIVLGSGTSHGIPVIACSCGTCRSRDKHNKRYRSSLYIKGEGGERIVIDTSTEFRLQALHANIKRLDAILITHSHADHLHGLDDLRPLTRKSPLEIYANDITIDDIHSRFSYIWRDTQRGGGKPKITANVATESFFLGSIKITPLPVKHGALDILGWLIEESNTSSTQSRAAYITDCSEIPYATLQMLDSISLLIIDGLRAAAHPTHFNFDKALSFAASITGGQLKNIFLTHISHEHKHKEINDYCKKWCIKNKIKGIKIAAAYDGLEIDVN